MARAASSPSNLKHTAGVRRHCRAPVFVCSYPRSGVPTDKGRCAPRNLSEFAAQIACPLARRRAMRLSLKAYVRAGAAAAVRLPLNALADYHMSVNCQPARRQCLPVIAPAQAIVRAGNGGVMRNYELPHRPCRGPGTRKDPPNSNLWFGGSCCTAMLPIRSNVQTRSALKRCGKCGSGTAAGLRARSGVEAGTAGRVACAKRRGSRTAASLASLRAAVGLC